MAEIPKTNISINVTVEVGNKKGDKSTQEYIDLAPEQFVYNEYQPSTVISVGGGMVQRISSGRKITFIGINIPLHIQKVITELLENYSAPC